MSEKRYSLFEEAPEGLRLVLSTDERERAEEAYQAVPGAQLYDRVAGEWLVPAS